MGDTSKVMYILIRYSILTKLSESWVIGRKTSFDEYKGKLFDLDRLNAHYQIFSSVTAPSIDRTIKRSKQEVKCIVLTSTDLPSDAAAKLESEAQKYPWLQIHRMGIDTSYGAEFEQIVDADLKATGKDKVVYSTTRLDDDDALADDFIPMLEAYLDQKYKGLAVSLAKGYLAYMRDGKFVSFVERNFPKIAQGFSYVDVFNIDGVGKRRTIYSLGNHIKVDEKYPVILDAKKPAYLWGIHEESDLSQSNKSRTNNRHEPTSFGEVLKHFRLPSELLSEDKVD